MGGEIGTGDGDDLRTLLRRFLALERDVVVLSVAMFAFSLGFQMTSRYIPRYMSVLGAGAVAIGLFGTFGNLIGAVYPYPGGALSDRIGSRVALTLFGLASTVGFVVWLFADLFGVVTLPPVGTTVELLGREFVAGWLEPATIPVGIFLGLAFAQAWKSFGLGATFAIVKQAVEPDRLATGFASTETFRRTAFLLGPLLPPACWPSSPSRRGFGSSSPSRRRSPSARRSPSISSTTRARTASVRPSRASRRSSPTSGRCRPTATAARRRHPRPLRERDGVRFFIIVVTEFLAVGARLPLVGRLSPDAYFGVLLAIEMLVALAIMIPVSRLSRRVGLKPVVALGFAVYAVFPVLLINAPENATVLALLFAFSGLRFAGLPAHKALIVGPAAAGTGGRVTGSYYLVRNVVVIPSAAIGGAVYAVSPEAAFVGATAIGLAGLALFLVFGREFEAAMAE